MHDKIKVLITSVHQCPCGRWVHDFCGRGIGEEDYRQQREYTDCQKIAPGDKTGSISSPIEGVGGGAGNYVRFNLLTKG